MTETLELNIIKFTSFTNMLRLLIFISAGFFFAFSPLLGQNGKKISIHSENNQVIDATTEPATQYLNGDVKVYHEGTFMYCDTAVLRGPDLRMYFNVVLMQNDTIKIFADSLHYNGDSLVAYLYGNIILENGPDKKLYTTYLRYDVKNKIGYYTRNARLIDKTSTLISRRGRYLLNEKTAFFIKMSKLQGRILIWWQILYLTIPSIKWLLSYLPLGLIRIPVKYILKGGGLIWMGR
ncbi:MAG: hypothetical protein IPP49_18355 [Saprospiraceae bacterium]|nr:hypothetical protein [Saprospiraceae bacterium]